MTEPRLRLNEILDHALSINKQYQEKKRVRKKILSLLEKELHEGKEIILKLSR